MVFTWNWFGVPGLVFLAIAWALAVVVFTSRPERSQNRRLALLLLIEGLAIGSGLGVLYFLERAADGYAVMVVRESTTNMLIPAYLLFLATIDSPLVGWLRGRAVTWVLKASIVAIVLSTPLTATLFIKGMRGVPYAPWECSCATEPAFIVLGVVLLFGFAATITGWLGTPKGTAARRQAGALALAFGFRDALLGPLVLFISTVYSFDNWGQNAALDFLFLNGQTIILLIFALLVSYGILKAQLFDIDLRLKFTLRQSTVATIFIVVFFVVSEMAATLFSDRVGPVLGILAAGLLLFAITPLQRFAERVSDAALPGVENTPEYLRYRKFEVYRHALESAAQDGRITERERRVLTTLQEDLGIATADAEAMEAALATPSL